jgi:beta-glucosidase
VGVTLSVQPAYAATQSAADKAAALRVDLEANRMFLSPLLAAKYPDDFWETIGAVVDLSFIQDGDERAIGQPLDFIGLNYYHGNVVRAATSAEAAAEATDAFDGIRAFVAGDDTRFVSRDLPRTQMGWEIDPQGLYDILWEVAHDYPNCPPLYVTENGIALDEEPGEDGLVHDEGRIDYLRTHLQVARQAIEDGIDLRGYYIWTFIDCYEWADGYTRKFGLYSLDEETMERTPKDSARWLPGVIERNAI